jgi:hypothetical protein
MGCDAKTSCRGAGNGCDPDCAVAQERQTSEPCSTYIFRHRNLACWSRLKKWRAIATRCDKTATSYAAGIAIAATLDWFKSSL